MENLRFFKRYTTPEGFSDIILTSDGMFLTGLYFESPVKAEDFSHFEKENDLPAFGVTEKWLNEYFGGKRPDFTPDINLSVLTPFQRQTLEIVKEIPYGKSVTYGEIARKIAKERGIEKMSAQAVGGAVGSNPVCIIIPCHRVLGAGGKLTGYGGGLNNKISLLKLENIRFSK